METKAVSGAMRWIYAAVGLVVLLFAGFVYGWSVFAAPIGADFPQWSAAELSLTFTICMAFFCLGGFAAGNLSKRIPVRVNVLFSAALFLVGFFLVSRASSLPMLYVSYGVLCGTASGFAYNSVMSTMTKWLPNNQGLISGVLLMGFGSSSMVLGALFDAMTPAETGAWRQTFLIMGVVMAVVIGVSALFFRLPPPAAPAQGTQNASGPDIPRPHGPYPQLLVLLPVGCPHQRHRPGHYLPGQALCCGGWSWRGRGRHHPGGGLHLHLQRLGPGSLRRPV